MISVKKRDFAEESTNLIISSFCDDLFWIICAGDDDLLKVVKFNFLKCFICDFNICCDTFDFPLIFHLFL